MLKKVVAMLAAIAMLASLAVFASASTIVETADKTENEIRDVLTELFEVKNHYLAGEAEQLDVSDLLLEPDSDEVGYFQRFVVAKRKILESSEMELVEPETNLTFDRIEVNNKTAKVDLYEWFSFTYHFLDDNSYLDDRSGEGMDYSITLSKSNGNWKIQGIDFDSDFASELRDPNADVDLFIQNSTERAIQVDEGVVVQPFNNGVNPYSVSMVNVSYNTESAVSYARTYGGENRNSLFPAYSSDCQNFASQCVWMGLGGVNNSTNVSNRKIPMVDGYARSWFNGGGNHSASWTAVDDFANYITSATSTSVGPYGTTISGCAYARPGDIIQFSDDGGATYYHSVFVVLVKGTEGSRTTNQIFVSAHTTDLSGVLLSGHYDSGTTFRIVRVWGAHYLPKMYN